MSPSSALQMPLGYEPLPLNSQNRAKELLPMGASNGKKTSLKMTNMGQL
jgi:hypothetical protein